MIESDIGRDLDIDSVSEFESDKENDTGNGTGKDPCSKLDIDSIESDLESDYNGNLNDGIGDDIDLDNNSAVISVTKLT